MELYINVLFSRNVPYSTELVLHDMSLVPVIFEFFFKSSKDGIFLAKLRRIKILLDIFAQHCPIVPWPWRRAAWGRGFKLQFGWKAFFQKVHFIQKMFSDPIYIFFWTNPKLKFFTDLNLSTTYSYQITLVSTGLLQTETFGFNRMQLWIFQIE